MKQDIIDLNRHDQLYDKGIDSEGNSLGEYAARTIQHKIETGERYDHVTLKDTSDFYESFKIKNGSEGIIITADTNKGGDDLAFIYGPKILGLTPENVAEVRGWLRPIILKETRQRIFG